jgi:predicted phosphodiesterase
VRIAALYDVHANLAALDAVLEEVRKERVDRIVVGGDVVPGPFPVETMERLHALEIPTAFIQGNGDREVLEQMRGIESDWYRASPEKWREPVRWSAQQLTVEDQHWLASWPMTHGWSVPPLGEVLFCHATPRSDSEIFTRLTPEERLRPLFAGLGVSIVVCGHTHMQFDRMIGNTRVVNAGSVGMPFGNPGADWLLIGPDIQLRHSDYDLAGAADQVRRSKYTQAEEFAANNILQPPSEEITLAAFRKAELQ